MTWIEDKKKRDRKWARESKKIDRANAAKLNKLDNKFRAKIFPYKDQIEQAVIKANDKLKKEDMEALFRYNAGNREIVIKPFKERLGTSSKNVEFEKGHFVIYISDEYKPVFGLRDSSSALGGVFQRDNRYEIKNCHVSKTTSDTVINMMGVIFEKIRIRSGSYYVDDVKLFKKTFRELVPLSKIWYVTAAFIFLFIIMKIT